MSHRFQRIRQFNNAELHPYSNQYNPCLKATCQVVPSVDVMMFALPVGGDNIWPIGRGIPWGNLGCLPVVTLWHTLHIGLYIWSVFFIYFLHFFLDLHYPQWKLRCPKVPQMSPVLFSCLKLNSHFFVIVVKSLGQTEGTKFPCWKNYCSIFNLL